MAKAGYLAVSSSSCRCVYSLFRRLLLERLIAAHQAGQLKFFGDYAALADAQALATLLAPLRRSE
jgi:hypothetical protein